MSNTPLEENPTSGGEPAKPSSTPILQNETDQNLEEATEMLNEATINANTENSNENVDLEEEEEDHADGDMEDDDEEDEGVEDEDEDDVDDEDDNNGDEHAGTEEVEVEIVDEEDDVMAMLPEKVRQRVEKLKEFHEARNVIMSDYLAERAALEKKYAHLHEPLYTQRFDVIRGSMDEQIEVEQGNERSKGPPQAQLEQNNESDDDENVVGIPQFWICAMGNMEAIGELIADHDVDCLEHLVNISCDDFPDGNGFTLKFHFEANDYFHNSILTKSYDIPNLLLDDEPILKNVVGCTIQWKDPSRALTHNLVTKKQRAKRGKHAGKIRTVTRQERRESFFHFFQPPKMPSLEDMDEEEADAIEEIFDQDYEVAQAFRSHLIPKGVLWFTGEALDEGFDIDLEDQDTTEDVYLNVYPS